MAKITPVPNGHLIKKDGTSLKNGGKVKNAFKKINKSIDPSSRYSWMNKTKKELSEIQPVKKKKK